MAQGRQKKTASERITKKIKMDGLYLYCIREQTEEPPLISAKGIDGKGRVFIFPYRDLEAVVSWVSLEEFASEEIQKKAKEDLNWIKEKALAHEKVIEEAMRTNNRVLRVIPMRFGTIFKEKDKLEDVLDKDYSRFTEVLERLRAKQEWSIKAYLKDKKILEQMIKEKNETLKGKEKEIASMPEGMAYFAEEELKEVIAKEIEKELDNIVNLIFASLKKHAVDIIINKILEKELTGRSEPMVLNAAYLVPNEKIGDFKKESDDLNQAIKAMGLCLEYSGPWPAYNFTNYD